MVELYISHMQRLIGIANFIDALNERMGNIAAWMTGLLVIIACVDVLLRNLLNQTAVWVIELEWHIFALIFLFGAGFALKHQRHVRVDLFYEKFSVKDKALVNMIGHLLFLLPWCGLVLFAASQYAYQSFLDGETSDTPGGLPFRFLIKSAIVVGFLLLLLQGLANGIRAWQQYRNATNEPEKEL